MEWLDNYKPITSVAVWKCQAMINTKYSQVLHSPISLNPFSYFCMVTSHYDFSVWSHCWEEIQALKRSEKKSPSPVFFFNESTRPYWISFYYPENRLQLSVNTVFAWPRSSLKYLINNTWCWSEISVIRQGVNCKLSWHFLRKDYPQCVSTYFLSKPEPSFKEFENHIASTF